jgi:hypothetical protein
MMLKRLVGEKFTHTGNNCGRRNTGYVYTVYRYFYNTV